MTNKKRKTKNQLSMEDIESLRDNSVSSKKPNPVALILLFSLFIVSITLLTIGLLKGKNIENQEISEPTITEMDDDSENVTDYFEEAFSKSFSGDVQDEVYLQDDPFREACAATSGDGVPAITFGTVCYR